MVTRVVRHDGKSAGDILAPINPLKKKRDGKKMMATRVVRNDGNKAER